MLFLIRFWTLVAAAACPFAYPAGAQPGEILSRQIVAESGFQGGLIVIAGGGNAELAVSLGKASNVLVHWLVPDGIGLADARREIRDANAYGRVSAMAWKGSQLPYVDSMVNLLLLQGDRTVDLDRIEVKRVLAPLGVAVRIRSGVTISSYERKPWPEDVDE